MKITTYKTNKAIQEVPASSTERRTVNDFFLTIVDGVLVDVEDSNTSSNVLIIPDDVKAIGEQAFEGVCVKEVILPEGLKSIEDEAFRKSTLEKIDLTNVKSLGDRVFEFSELKEVTYSKYLTYIPEKCFRGSELTEFEVPKQVKILKENCFDGTNLKRIDLSGITLLGNGGFFDCFKLKEIILSEAITEIPDNFCRRCQSLEKVDLSHVKVIGTNAFSGCSNLNAGSLSAKIYQYAFEGTAIRHLEIKDISKVYEGAYRCCDKLESVTISGNGGIPDRLFSECDKLKNVTIDEGVTIVGDAAFKGTAIETIVLPSVTAIKDEAFKECKCLKDVTLNTRLIKIADAAFMHTKNLSAINIPDGVRYIGSECFAFSGIKRIRLPKNDIFMVVLRKTFAGCKNLEEIELPDNVKAINDNAFDKCTLLRHINLDNIQVIGPSAFAETALEHITLSAREIGAWAFNHCGNLKKADLSGISTKILSSHLFFECNNLSEISLPKNQIKKFSNNCFYHTAISEITFDADNVIVGPNAFGMTNLKKVVISENCNDILFQDYAFRQAEVDEFVIPDFLEKVINHDLERIF